LDTLFLEAHRHGIVLVRPLSRALVLGLAGAACFLAPWTATAAAGAVLLALAALVAVVAVTRWDRMHVRVTEEALVVEDGLLRRRSASVVLGRGAVVEIERTLLGRILGYGTVVAGGLEIDCVPWRVAKLVQQRR
jgi:uncharacterized membrane protein YdbT with pleckstrin-like domain